MPGSPVPAPPPIPVPGPPALFHVLWIATFVVHMLFVNLVLGGSTLGTLALAFGPKGLGRKVASFFTEVNGWAVSLAVTFGIAPLLFLQVLYGRFFYAATVLVAWGWLGMLVLLMAGYYLTYVAKYRFRAGKGAAAPLALSALLFLAVAATQVAVHLLTVQPQRWGAVSAAPWSALADPSFLPRWLHFVLSGVTLAALLLGWKAVRKDPAEAERAEAEATARWGIKVTLVVTVFQLLDGFWLLGSLPAPVVKAFMTGGATTLVPLTLGIVAGLGILVVLAGVTDPVAQRKKVRHALELLLGAILVMVVTRHQVRDLYLAAARAGEKVDVAPQWGAFGFFLACFVVCLGLTVWIVVKAVKDRPAPGEETA